MREKCKQNLTLCGSKCKPRKSLWRRGRLFAPLMPLLVLTGCQSTNGTQTSAINGPLDGASFCQAARAIYYSRHDTAPTIEQIREHNAVGAALKCGWLPAKSLAKKGAKP